MTVPPQAKEHENEDVTKGKDVGDACTLKCHAHRFEQCDGEYL